MINGIFGLRWHRKWHTKFVGVFVSSHLFCATWCATFHGVRKRYLLIERIDVLSGVLDVILVLHFYAVPDPVGDQIGPFAVLQPLRLTR